MNEKANLRFYVAFFFVAAIAGGIAVGALGVDQPEHESRYGFPTNCLRAGFFFEGRGLEVDLTTGKHLGFCGLALTNTCSDTIEFFFPPGPVRNMFVITEEGGAPVKKREGKDFQAKLSDKEVLQFAEWRHAGFYRSALAANAEYTYGDSLPNDYISTVDFGHFFYLTNAGEYRVTRTAVLYFSDTNRCLRRVQFSPVTVPLIVK